MRFSLLKLVKFSFLFFSYLLMVLSLQWIKIINIATAQQLLERPTVAHPAYLQVRSRLIEPHDITSYKPSSGYSYCKTFAEYRPAVSFLPIEDVLAVGGGSEPNLIQRSCPLW